MTSDVDPAAPWIQIEWVRLETCASTQHEARLRLDVDAARHCVAVQAQTQTAGQGRDGRTWDDRPGDSLLLSVGVRGPLPLTVLEDLPRRVTHALVEALGVLDDRAHVAFAWDAPNDLIEQSTGAKVAGVLVDARTVGTVVDVVVVGLGVNVLGDRFQTTDGRVVSTVCAALARDIRVEDLCAEVAPRIAALLTTGV